VAPVKWLPVMATVSPPAALPAFGVTADTDGAGPAVKVKLGPPEDVPLGVTTLMVTVPGDSAGVTARTSVSDRTVNDAALVPPKSTSLAPVKPVPVMVTVSPPAVLPEEGLSEVTLGADASV